MPAPTDAEVIAAARARFPLAALTTDAVLTAWLPWCRAHVSLGGEWSPYELDALACLLGHCGEVYLRDTAGGLSPGGGSGVIGAVTGATSGRQSVQRGMGASAWTPGSATDADLMQTAGGRAFLGLRDTRPLIVVPAIW
jgi:hypothetical protein